MRYGYACINLSLAEEKIKVNRSMMKRFFLEKGIAYASALALSNVTDLEKLIEWNIRNDMLFYRMSSDMFPWMSEYELSDLPDYEMIRIIHSRCGDKAFAGNLRLSFHPGPFNVLASMSEEILIKTVKELRQHAEIMEMLKLPATVFSKINIHVGGAYGNRQMAMDRFAENFIRLPSFVQKRLTIENDDKANMFSTRDLLWLHQQIGLPVVFDYFHHGFCTGGLSEEEALMAAKETWPSHTVPVVHFSSSRRQYEDGTVSSTSHADYLYQNINTYGCDMDIMFEAKAKELAVMKFRKDYNY